MKNTSSKGNKSYLPSRTCSVCECEFTWREK
ncbi:DUF2256 domain-containing protein [Flavobacterium arcticum]|uniref:DUF2256 domain-containing protein n=1 Tax=Flavobacterium arcticum TaxID=1784713 RepID=A0A345H966_9FLAO|nr:DUF2256 domain-containing protein [Flavobacterium arcticum]KAF2512917.1 DUF2256 domain-containing protein [Flavobacterium arcticum]